MTDTEFRALQGKVARLEERADETELELERARADDGALARAFSHAKKTDEAWRREVMRWLHAIGAKVGVTRP